MRSDNQNPGNHITLIIAILILATSLIWSNAEAQHPDDQYWSGLSFPEPTWPPHGNVTALTVRDNELIVATAWVGPHGMFSGSAITRWDGYQYEMLAFAPGAEGPTSLFGCLDYYNDELIVGGFFYGAEGLTHVARWDGTDWQIIGTWVAGTDFDNGTPITPEVIVTDAEQTFDAAALIRFRVNASNDGDHEKHEG